MKHPFTWIDKVFLIVYLTNGSNFFLFELMRFILFQVYFVLCLVRAELDLFRRIRRLFRLEYFVGWISLQLWLVVPVILTVIHGRMNRRVMGLIRDMKELYAECGIPETVLRHFAWKMVVVQVILSTSLAASTAYHMLTVSYQWTLIDVSCLIPCAWFVHVPVLQLIVWMGSLRLLHDHVTSAIFDVVAAAPVSQIREFKRLIGLVNALLVFRGRVAKTYGNSLMLYVLCCLACIIYLTYNCILPGGEVYISKAVQWLLCLFVTCLVPTLVTDEVSRFVTRLTKISETQPYSRIHSEVHHFLTRMLHEDSAFRLHELCHLSLHTFLRIMSGALAYVVIQYQLRPND